MSFGSGNRLERMVTAMMPDYEKQFAELAEKKLSAEDLALKGRCHREETVSGSGRNRVTRFRSDVQCKAGSIEEPVWYRLIWDLAVRSGEEQLLKDLISYNAETLPFLHTKKEQENYSLETYSIRIFDHERWVAFLDFNQKYRPNALKGIAVAEIETECCKKNSLTTMARIEHDRKVSPETSFCPICGSWSRYKIIREFKLD